MALTISNDPGVLAIGAVTLKGANLNQTSTDLVGPDGVAGIPIPYPSGSSRYKVNAVYVSHASTSLTTATMSVYTAAAAGGTAIVSDAALSGITSSAENTAANQIAMSLVSLATTSFNGTRIYPRVGTAQGAVATADITINLQFLP